MAEKGKFRLEVPLDASGIKDFKPERPVKVVAYDRQDKVAGWRKLTSTLMEKATRPSSSKPIRAHFRWSWVRRKPATRSSGACRRSASTCLPRDGARATWRNSRPSRSAAYYWWWWWRWCREYTITGKLVCANGSPVVGATVCAYDVDWWWWWTSQEQVACATTDINGAFSMTFTRCCGWWPWWWWQTREWLLDPILVERISNFPERRFAIRTPTARYAQAQSGRLPAVAADSRPADRATVRRQPAPQGSPVALSSHIDPGALDSLRNRLVNVLPKDFPIRIWPWYPWFPWWDCDADIIFKATQFCGSDCRPS